MTDNEIVKEAPDKKFKVTFHFINDPDGFLEGYHQIVSDDVIYPFEPLEYFAKFDNYITKWKGKWICINLKNISYMECQEVMDNG